MFFFFKQKTAYEMRISDWSSDVCSSDLGGFSVDFGNNRRYLEHEMVQVGHRYLPDPESVEPGAELRCTPEEDKDRQDPPGKPRLEHGRLRMAVPDLHGRRLFFASLAGRGPDPFRLRSSAAHPSELQ